MSEEKKAKRVADSQTEQSYVLMTKHINGCGRLFGGQLVSWIDEVAGIVARRHSQTNVVTAAIDNLVFKAGAGMNDIIVLIGRLTYVGRTSMEVRIDTYVESVDGMRTVINRAYVLMVAMDDQVMPMEVPGLIIEGEGERAEWEAGERRSKLRMSRKKEGY